MRHAKKNNHLGRTAAHRQAMLSNMAASLLLHKRISTTLAKAKELRKYIEPLITRGKEDTTHSRRVVFSYLQNKFAVSELFREISQKVADRPGGYTRILKTGFRKGDNAEMCIIELVDYNETYTTGEEKKKTTKTRRGRGGKGKVASGEREAVSGTRNDEMIRGLEDEVIEDTPVVEETPIIEEPAVEEPAVEEPAVEEPAVEEPAVEEPAVEEPAVEEPVVEETPTPETSVEEK